MSRAQPHSIAAALRAVRAEVQPETPLARVQAAWAEAVGEPIAANAEPVAERAGVITVACSAATWAQELDLLRPELLGRLHERLGVEACADLRFVVGEGRYSDPD